jgi:3-isopropylmalate/(R)-2-methylmalate dehydratase small subunit
MRRAAERVGYSLTIDLEEKKVFDADGFEAAFSIGDFQRHCLLEGLDDIGLTLQHESRISDYEARRPLWLERRSERGSPPA